MTRWLVIYDPPDEKALRPIPGRADLPVADGFRQVMFRGPRRRRFLRARGKAFERVMRSTGNTFHRKIKIEQWYEEIAASRRGRRSKA